MKSSSLFRIIFFVIVAIFVLNFVVVLVYFPLATSSASSSGIPPVTLKLQNLESFGNFEEDQQSHEKHRRQQQLAPREEEGKQKHLRKGATGRTQRIKTATEISAKIGTNSTAKKATNSTSKCSFHGCPVSFPKIVNNSTQNCESYGCPVYPPELTTPLTNQTIRKALEESGYSFLPLTSSNKTKQNLSNFTFASETFVTLSLQGASHEVNQDRGLYVSPFLPKLLSTTLASKNSTKSFLTCIFDGHGELGHKVAQEVVEKFPLLLSEKLTLALSGINKNSADSNEKSSESHNQTILVNQVDYDSTDRAIRKALNETFLEVNEKGDPSNFFLGGCTASVTLRWGPRLYVANTGDSETIVVSAFPPQNMQQQEMRRKERRSELWTAKVEYNTRRDKANQPDERARIEKLGGKIHINAKGFDPRVILHSEAAHDTIGLAMSRSIGDWEWKAVGVTAEPTIDVIDLSKPPLPDSDKTIFLLAASDGFWDMRQKPFYASRMAASFRNDDKDNWNSREKDASFRPLYHLYDIIQKITPKNQNGYRDDITVTIVNLE